MASPFDLAWTILKGDADWYWNGVDAIQTMFGVDHKKAAEMMEQIHRYQLSQAGIPQDKIDREYSPEGGSDYLNNKFMYPLSHALMDVQNTIHDTANMQQKKDEKSRSIGRRTSRDARSMRGLRGNPRVPQTSEEASYANISIPRESPIYGLEPFGEDEPMGATLPMPMADDIEDDILEPIRQRQREEEPFNPFTVKPSPPSPPPMGGTQQMAPMGGTEGLSRGPMRSRKRGDPASSPRFVRPGFRSTEAMPLTDDSASRRSQ